MENRIKRNCLQLTRMMSVNNTIERLENIYISQLNHKCKRQTNNEVLVEIRKKPDTRALQRSFSNQLLI